MKTPKPTRQDNFIWLLFALALLMFTDALFAQLGSETGNRWNNLMLLIVIFVAVWTIEEKRGKWLRWKIAVSGMVGIILVSDAFVQHDIIPFLKLSAAAVFLTFTLAMAWKQVMFVGHVNRNTIVGAICIYVLIGLIWAYIYLALEELFPGSLGGLEGDDWQRNVEAVTYYSMVTLTTLGYGDITPQQPLAQFFAYAEAIAGIFYTTVLVASLIGMQLAAHTRKLVDSQTQQ